MQTSRGARPQRLALMPGEYHLLADICRQAADIRLTADVHHLSTNADVEAGETGSDAWQASPLRQSSPT